MKGPGCDRMSGNIVHLWDESSKCVGGESDGRAFGNLLVQNRDGEREAGGKAGGGLEGETYHVIGDVHAKSSGFVVHKRCRVDGEGGHADVQHVAVLRRQRKGWSRERRFLMLPNVVKLALSKKEKPCDVSHDQTFSFSDY